MPIPFHLNEALLTFECSHCCYVLVKKGNWFRSASQFRCPKCGNQQRITYDDKLRIFAKGAKI
jgi:Zn finger protein HypA/HybF involved in hydrogenase expression